MKIENQFLPGQVVFHKTDLIGNWPMVIIEIPEYSEPENQDLNVSWMTKNGFLKHAEVSSKAVRHAKGI